MRRALKAIKVAYLLNAPYLRVLASVGGLVLEDRVGDELAEILVGSHHICGEPLLFGATGEGADHIVSLIALDFHHRYAVSSDDILDIGDSLPDVFGSLIALGFILLELPLAEGRTGRVEADSQMGGVLSLQQVFEGIYKTEYGRGVKAVLGDARHTYQGVICSEYQGVSIKKEELFHKGLQCIRYDIGSVLKITEPI